MYNLERWIDKLLIQIAAQYKKVTATRLGYAVVCIVLLLAICFMFWQVLREMQLGYFKF